MNICKLTSEYSDYLQSNFNIGATQLESLSDDEINELLANLALAECEFVTDEEDAEQTKDAKMATYIIDIICEVDNN